MGFGQRVNEILIERGMTPADLSRQLGWNTGVLSQYMNNPDRDPRLSTAIKVSEALHVSLEYLAGWDEEEEREGPKDPLLDKMIEGFGRLPYRGKLALLEQLEFQLSKSEPSMPVNQVSGVA